MHSRLIRRLSAATRGRALDVARFLQLVGASYAQFERDLRRLRRKGASTVSSHDAPAVMRRKRKEEMPGRDERFRVAMDGIQHGVCIIDGEGRIFEYNRSFGKMCDFDVSVEYRGRTVEQILDTWTAGHSDAWRELLTVEHGWDSRNGGYVAIEKMWPDGRVLRLTRTLIEGGGRIETVADVTALYLERVRLQRLATFDPLTNLPNRVLFHERLMDAITATHSGELGAVMYIDLDRFKAVNDTHGHPIGDQLLTEVAERLRGLLRSADIAARLGGDEFAVILRRLIRPADAEQVARRIVGHLSAPYCLDGRPVTIGASVGIAFIRTPDLTADDLLRDADMALYRAKGGGRGTYAIHHGSQESVVLKSPRGVKSGIIHALGCGNG